MTTHATVKNSDRTALPRALLGRRPSFHFSIGQTVDFYGRPAVIMGRSLSSMGHESYNIAIACAERPHRIVRGEYLAPLTPEYGAAAAPMAA